MKKSEQLISQSRCEENDIKAFSLLNKSIRERRLERFEDYIPELLDKGYSIRDDNYRYTIFGTKDGTIDYFPKANKVLIRDANKWFKQGFRWIIKNL